MLNAQDYKNTLKCFASGVTILSWRDSNQDIQGITVSAFSALSLNPPLVLFCITQNSFIYPELCRCEHIAINILAEGQQPLAYQFAGGDRNGLTDKFHENNPHGLPYLHDTHANLSIRITQRIPAGDHDIFIGEVLHSDTFPERLPLIYHNGKL